MSTTLSFAAQANKWNTADDVKDAAEAIRSHKDLQCLVLEANTLGVEAAEMMGDALANHPEFERAHWKDLFTGRLKREIPEALRHLFSGLIRAGAKLRELDLSDNALGPVGVEGMLDFMCSPVCYSLQELRLNNNGLGITGGTMLAKSLMKLVENAKAAGTQLQLKVFISGRNRLELEGAKVFAEFFRTIGTLEEVAMPQNGIFAEGIDALASALSVNPNLRILNLNDNTFTPKGARAMAEKLPSMQNLEVINFGDCLLKTNGAISIAKALESGHIKLRELYLDSNEIKIEGGLHIVKALANKEQMTTLMLDGNQFGDEGKDCLVSALEDIGCLEILESLEDDENPDSDEEEEDDIDGDEEEDEDEVEGEEEVQEVEGSGVSPLLRRALSDIKPEKCTAAEFCDQPTAGRLIGLGNSGPSLLVEEAKKISGESDEAFITACIGIFMKTSSVAATDNEKVQQAVFDATEKLASSAFVAAQKENLSSVATNNFLVHLGLIKCE
ncbi:Ran GTPase-activating protein 1, partial [Halocaridina rubra]